MKNPLQRFTIATTGDFGPQRSHEKIRQRIEANGGTFAYNITPEVTHLVCSRENFKRGGAIVQEAGKIDGLSIVNFDWLEDTLMENNPRKEAGYLLQRQEKAAAKAKRARKAVRKDTIQKGVKAFEKGCEDMRKDMFSDGYHIYRDSTTFAYDITLARANLVSNQNERFHLKLLESHSEPSLYAVYAKSAAPGFPAAIHVLAPLGSSFDTALVAFTTFFALKAQRPWARRLAPPQHGQGDGGQEAFVYTPPEKGEPRGVMPEEEL